MKRAIPSRPSSGSVAPALALTQAVPILSDPSPHVTQRTSKGSDSRDRRYTYPRDALQQAQAFLISTSYDPWAVVDSLTHAGHPIWPGNWYALARASTPLLRSATDFHDPHRANRPVSIDASHKLGRSHIRQRFEPSPTINRDLA
ncbi:hypothetical protein DAEQUDRAFT_450899 [Daedalea quercina L-15889]|uniref:Uncharacterized protein n=1 Tax=Daedalea quercina L-15889 TaxID=1314783 RepID=A0A165N3W1_9APHY|nr:hypothetical protein DAEQUDRAFT_450899 [Daedalea quercina L-15889]